MISFIPIYPSIDHVKAGESFGDFSEQIGTMTASVGYPESPQGLTEFIIERPKGFANA